MSFTMHIRNDDVSVTIELDEYLKSLRDFLTINFPIPTKNAFSLIFKLWELKRKAPFEYNDELFSSVISELEDSQVLRRGLLEANRLNERPLTIHEVVENLTNLTISQVNSAVILLTRPLEVTLGSIIDRTNGSIHDVDIIRTRHCVTFKVKITV